MHNTINDIADIDKVRLYVALATSKYDPSHDYYHADAVSVYAYKIIQKTPSPYIIGYSDNKAIRVIVFAALLHDTCDHKYVNTEDALVDIKEELLLYCDEYDVENIITIINNISYSKEHKYGYPDLGPLQLARNIVSDADKLDALGKNGLSRCYIYGKHISPGNTTKYYKQRLYDHCVEKLGTLSDYIHTPYGKKLAVNRQKVICDFMENYKKNHYQQNNKKLNLMYKVILFALMYFILCFIAQLTLN